MEIIKKIRSWVESWMSFLFPGFPGRQDHLDLAGAVQESLREWKQVNAQFNYVEPGLIDYMVYRLNAAERHYIALLSLARTDGVKAWPDNLVDPAVNREDPPANPSSAPNSVQGPPARGTYRPPV